MLWKHYSVNICLKASFEFEDLEFEFKDLELNSAVRDNLSF